jgi:hypothetical protein
VSSVRDSVSLKDIASISVRDAASVLQPIAGASVRTGAGLKAFFSAMAASASPESITGYGNNGSPVSITTAAASVSVAGGVAPYTYAWTLVPDFGSWTIGAPTAQSTTFTAGNVAASDEASASFYCTVTDDAGAEAVTGMVAVAAFNLGGG